MFEWVKECQWCNGGGYRADPMGIWGPCYGCNGTGQQLIKPIPKGTVIISRELFDKAANWECPCEDMECNFDDCGQCWREWLKVQ